MIKRWIGYSILVVLLAGCKPAQTTLENTANTLKIKLSEVHTLVIADVADGQRRITTDAQERFFESVGVLDMQIQMGDVGRGDRATLLKDYRQHLAESVLPWSKTEAKALAEVMEEAHRLVSAVSPQLFPEEVALIKTNMNHYGAGTFYTRDNAIIIPENMMTQVGTEGFLQTMLHEIFHIYSRYHPRKREALYAYIGFQKISPPKMPDILSRRVLLNPDGVDYHYAIQVKRKSTGAEILAMPIVYSQYMAFDPARRGFFNYLAFDLFEVADGEVQTTRNGESTVPLSNITGFREQIGPNTDYIIHPDEVLADNFAFLCLSQAEGKSLAGLGLSEAGIAQLMALRDILVRP